MIADGKLIFPEQWLHIKNWEKFQYRSDKRLRWIRLDCALLEDRDFLNFDRATQRDLIAIWLLARNQSHSGWIPNDSKMVSKLIQGGRNLDLQVFVNAGFLEEKCALQDRTGQDKTEQRTTPLVKLPEKQQPDEPELFALEPPSNGNGNHPKLVSQAWEYYIKVMGRRRERLIFTPVRQRMGELRFKECLQKAPSHSPEDALALMMDCIDELPKSEFHMGKNDRSTRYIEWEHLFGSTKKLEMWIARRLDGQAK